jgi:hypothetical protein
MREMEAVRDQILGPKDQVTEEKAHRDKLTGGYHGGIAFERSDRAKCINHAPRCYPLSTTWQMQKNMDAPAVSNKVFQSEPRDSHEDLRRNLLQASRCSYVFLSQTEVLCQVVAICSVEGLKHGPAYLLDLVGKQSDMMNLPRVGHDSNRYFANMQLNVAPVLSESKCNAGSLKCCSHAYH